MEGGGGVSYEGTRARCGVNFRCKDTRAFASSHGEKVTMVILTGGHSLIIQLKGFAFGNGDRSVSGARS